MAKTRQCARNVDIYVDGVRHRYEAGDHIPEEHAKLVNNETVWTGEDPHNPAVTGGSKPLAPREESFDDDEAEDQDELESWTVAELTQYAATKNIELTSTKKADIIATIREAEGR